MSRGFYVLSFYFNLFRQFLWETHVHVDVTHNFRWEILYPALCWQIYLIQFMLFSLIVSNSHTIYSWYYTFLNVFAFCLFKLFSFLFPRNTLKHFSSNIWRIFFFCFAFDSLHVFCLHAKFSNSIDNVKIRNRFCYFVRFFVAVLFLSSAIALQIESDNLLCCLWKKKKKFFKLTVKIKVNLSNGLDFQLN